MEQQVERWKKGPKQKKNHITCNSFDVLNNYKYNRLKINEFDKTLMNYFPELEGDKVTFIGSTFWKYGEREPYLNNCIVLEHVI